MTDTTSFQIKNLTPNQDYKVTVWAYDGKDFSKYDSRYITTADKVYTNIKEFLASRAYSPKFLINDDLYNEKDTYPRAIESLPEKEAAYILTKTKTEITNKEIYVRGSGYQKIYPGALLLIDPQLTSGNPTPLSLARAPITIFGDFLAGGNPEVSNVDPNNADVRKACNKIMDTLLKDNRYEAPGNQRTTTKIYTSKKSMMMDFAVDSSFAGVDLKVSCKTNQEQQSFIQATTLEQDYFTVRLKDSWQQDPSKLFDKSVTVEDLKKALNGKGLAIVTSVTYGRTFSYLKEYSANKYTWDSSQKVSGYGQSVSGKESGSEEVTSTQEDIFNLGGSAITAAALQSTKTQAELEKAMAANMKFSHSNQGVITKYTIELVTGKYPGTVIKPLFNGTQYQIKYARCPRRLSMYVNVTPVRVGGPGGGDVEVHLDVECFKVINGKPDIFKTVNSDSPNKVCDPWYYTWNNSRTREMGDLKAGEYIKNDPVIRIKSRALKGARWTTDDSRRLNHGEIESGEMEVYLTGDVARSVKIKEIKSK